MANPHVQRPARLNGGRTFCACGRPWPCPRSSPGTERTIMSKPPLTPGTAAAADQLMAYCRDELATLAPAIRAGDEAHGEAQNGANFVAYLTQGNNAPFLAALVIAAIRQLPRENSS
jgi:hypothetical protein